MYTLREQPNHSRLTVTRQSVSDTSHGKVLMLSVYVHEARMNKCLLKDVKHILEGETGREAGEPCEAMKSASCLSAHRLDELPPFFICSWISTSSSSLNDCRNTDNKWLYYQRHIHRSRLKNLFSFIKMFIWTSFCTVWTFEYWIDAFFLTS